MRLNAPTKVVWYISLILGVLGILFSFITVPFFSAYAFWIVVVAWLLLILATVLKGL